MIDRSFIPSFHRSNAGRTHITMRIGITPTIAPCRHHRHHRRMNHKRIHLHTTSSRTIRTRPSRVRANQIRFDLVHPEPAQIDQSRPGEHPPARTPIDRTSIPSMRARDRSTARPRSTSAIDVVDRRRRVAWTADRTADDAG